MPLETKQYFIRGHAKDAKSLRPIAFARTVVLDITPRASVFGIAAFKEFGQSRTDQNGRFKIVIEDAKEFTKVKHQPRVGIELFTTGSKAQFQRLKPGVEPTYYFEVSPY